MDWYDPGFLIPRESFKAEFVVGDGWTCSVTTGLRPGLSNLNNEKNILKHDEQSGEKFSVSTSLAVDPISVKILGNCIYTLVESQAIAIQDVIACVNPI